MTNFILLRHGEPNFDPIRARNLKGWSADIAPLTSHGEHQIRDIANQVKKAGPQVIISSPMTRALQSAAIVTRLLNIPLKVEFDLHEWIPDLTFEWQTIDQVMHAYSALISGRHYEPPSESLESVRERTLRTLRGYLEYQTVLVVCHNVVIYSLTNQETTLGGIQNLILVP